MRCRLLCESDYLHLFATCTGKDITVINPLSHDSEAIGQGCLRADLTTESSVITVPYSTTASDADGHPLRTFGGQGIV
jgi:hypothetical protein